MTTITITRALRMPDELRLGRYLRTPELGPKVVFFSGGSALKDVARELIRYTHNSIHLITPFDSGGSSAKLRETFHMLAVGDLRNRLMSLADRSFTGNPQIFELFAHRLPKDAPQAELLTSLNDLARGKGRLIRQVPDPMRKIIRSHLRFFLARMPDSFDLRGASIGNLILAGGYFNYNRRIDPVIYLFSKLVEVRGVVRPIINQDLHLVAEMEDGRLLVGQHLLTGKETRPIDSPVKRVYLSDRKAETTPIQVQARDKVQELILQADLICYPVGSFYSSLVANLLPQGIGQAVSATACSKVYVPNPCPDPEQLGLSLTGCVERLLHYLRQGGEQDAPADKLLNFVMIDSKRGKYQGLKDLKKVKELGIEVIDTELVSEKSRPYLDPGLFNERLLSLV